MNMISKYLTILPAVAALLLAAACSNDDLDGLIADGPVAAQVTAAISNGQTVTRISNSGNTASFTEGDVIYVVADGSETHEYARQSDDSWSAVSSPYYFQDLDNVSFRGWYAEPTTAATATDNKISINTAEQTIANGWNQWDILVTPVVTTSVASPTVGFTDSNAFEHIMSQVTLTFKIGDGISDLSALREYKLTGLTTEASFNTLSCELTEGSTGDISQEVSVTSGVACDPIILVPQDVSGKLSLEVTYNDLTYSAELSLPSSATALTAGTHYTFNVTINNTGLAVNSAAIEDWTAADDQSGSATIPIKEGYTFTTDADGIRSYTVYDKDGLLAWSEYTRSGNYATNCTLGADITMTAVDDGESNWTAVGTSSNRYTGTFDGNGKTISGLTINTSESYIGLIGYLGSGGVVQNLKLVDANIKSTTDYVGAVVGYNHGTVTNCSVSGKVEGARNTGGVMGVNYYTGAVTACCSTASVTGSGNYTGGVMGAFVFVAVISFVSSGFFSVSVNNTGGVMGSNNSSGTVTACYSTGKVEGSGNYTGGVVGTNYSGTFTACYWSSDTTAGIGSGRSSDVTKVDGTTVTWTTAASAMNTALTGKGWQYTGDGTSDPPLTLVAE